MDLASPCFPIHLTGMCEGPAPPVIHCRTALGYCALGCANAENLPFVTYPSWVGCDCEGLRDVGYFVRSGGMIL